MNACLSPATLLVFAIFFAMACGRSGDVFPDWAVDAPFEPPPDSPADVTWDQPFDPFEDPARDPSWDPFEDPPADVPRDIPVDETPEVSRRFCIQSCSRPEECCNTTSTCGAYPNRWSCDAGYCLGVGCGGDAECVAWASGYGLPGADGYKCRGFEETYHNCVPGCATPDDCCAPSLDCSRYPLRYLCDGGGCLLDMCLDDGECRSYAATYSLPRPELYVCRALGVTPYRVCVQSCAYEADCCPPGREPCDAYPYHYACTGGICTATCDGDGECQAYAASTGLPNPGSYACRTF
jgi:hypothetical protein